MAFFSSVAMKKVAWLKGLAVLGVKSEGESYQTSSSPMCNYVGSVSTLQGMAQFNF